MFKKFFPLVLLIGVLGLGGVAYAFFRPGTDSAPLRPPYVAHHHFRLQLVVEGESVDFSQEQFQEPYTAGICSGDLTETPIHFHDNKDQFVHIHWDKITGGQVLKYYGLNLIGGPDETIDYRPTEEIEPTTVPIKDKLLPEPSPEVQYWVYVGDETEYRAREAEEFLREDLEEFFGVKSQITINRETMAEEEEEDYNYQPFRVRAAAQTRGMDHSMDTGEETTEEELKDLHNLLGNVVIFAQEAEPTPEQITARFDDLVPLEKSSCGG